MAGLPPALRPLLLAWVFLLGAAIGSFLNVVVARLPAGQSLVRPRSRCPRCGAAIAWYDNLPVLSWILLRARCRACRARISARYPLVEALGGAAALLAFERHGLSARAAAELAFASALLALAFIDLDTWLLPHAITWPLIAAGALLSALGLTDATGLGASLLGAAIGFAVFALVAWLGEKVFRREALGFGDVWLLAGLGAWLGPGALLPLVLLASLQGSAVGIALLLLGRGTPGPAKTTTLAAGSRRAPDPTTSTETEDDWVPPRNAVPFGPFLVAGALEWLYLAAPMARLFPPLEAFR